MAKIHLLDRASPATNDFAAVAHFAMPAGNNSVGVLWKTCYLGSFGTRTPTSLLPSSGNNNPAPGKIGNTELNQIVSGDLIEVPFLFSDDTSLDDTQRQALINLLADRAIAEFQAVFSARFKFYGYTQG